MDTVATVPFSSTRAYLLEARYEFLRLLRTPSFSLPCLLFPPVFYLLFGVLLGGKGGPVAAQYLLAGYGVFGVIVPYNMPLAMFSNKVSMALAGGNTVVAKPPGTETPSWARLPIISPREAFLPPTLPRSVRRSLSSQSTRSLKGISVRLASSRPPARTARKRRSIFRVRAGGYKLCGAACGAAPGNRSRGKRNRLDGG